ncbi:G-protein coupled receptor GRL101-like [Diadema antillarum]|uniref:G-protein coupled receptor GRL101-like n=1 Tax=Diadema antillarum TaxID=105358 RepID=UPI003A8B06A6
MRNVSGNAGLVISAEVFFDLKRLHILDMTQTNTKSNIKATSDAFKNLSDIKHIYTDNYGFCCLKPSGATCHGITNQFSSCDDLLKDISLRVFMWILGLSALLGNAAALWLRLRERGRSSQNPVQLLLIANLAISDLVMGFYMLIIASADACYRGNYAHHAEEWTSSKTCQMAGFLSVLSSEVSVLLVMLISIDRYLSVVFPFKTKLHLNATSARILVAASWFFSLILSLVPALPLPYFRGFYGVSSVCLGLPLTKDRVAGWEYSIAVFICTNFVCFLLTFLCYFVIYISVRRSHKRVMDLGAVNSRMIKEQITMTTKMALVVGTDFVCWMPIIIMGILASSGVVDIPGDTYAWTAVFILPLNSSLNPYLYTLSAVLQRRKELKSESGSMSMQTKSNNVTTYVEEQLRNNCVISSCVLSEDRSVEPITSYLNRCGGELSSAEGRLVARDLRKALICLSSAGVKNTTLSASTVAVEKDEHGDLRKALYVVSNPADVKRLFGIGTDGLQCKLDSLWDRVKTGENCNLRETFSFPKK